MVGKTNLTFISKGEGSGVQLIQKSYVTDVTGRIWKIEKTNDDFFVFNTQGNVLVGTDMGNLSFVKRDQKNLIANHIIFKDGFYYCTKYKDNYIYKTKNFSDYEEIQTDEKNTGIFLDSRGRIVLLSHETLEEKDSYGNPLFYEHENIRIGESIEDILNDEPIVTGKADHDYETAIMISNRIYLLGTDWIARPFAQLSLAGEYIKTEENYNFKVHSYAGGYFFYMSDIEKLYRSRDGINATLVSSEMGNKNIKGTESAIVIPISGKFCFRYKTMDQKSYINIADDIFNIASPENPEIEQVDDITITSVLEDDEKTYVGTSNGVIYEFQLDYEGVMQRPDVAIIKTMAAKQALSQSLQYTDESIENIKKYIDDKIQEIPSIETAGSTEVKPAGNID